MPCLGAAKALGTSLEPGDRSCGCTWCRESRAVAGSWQLLFNPGRSGRSREQLLQPEPNSLPACLLLGAEGAGSTPTPHSPGLERGEQPSVP